MYTPIYNRLCGWLFFALGIVGFTSGHVGTYIYVSTGEGVVYIVVGMLGMVGARLRHRDASLLCTLLGIALFLFGLAGFAWPTSWLGTNEPLESALRIVSGLWGMYCSVNDVLAWRSALLQET